MTQGLDSPAALPSGSSLVQARLTLALEAAQMGLWDYDLATGRLVWDDRSAAIYGTTVAESTGTIADVDTRVHPDDLPRVRDELATAIATAGAVDVEFRVVWPSGDVRWVYGRGQALVDTAGEVVRVIGTNVDVTEQRRAAQQQAADAQRRAGLVAVAQALGEAQSEAEVLDVVDDHGVRVLGAQGAALILAEPERATVQVLTTRWFAEDLRREVAELPADLALPPMRAIAAGVSYFFTDRAETVAQFPVARSYYEAANTEASAALPLRARGHVIGALGVAVGAPHIWRPAERELLEALASLTAQAVDRVRARRAESLATAAVRRLAETLQRSLLTPPPQVEDLQVAVRYQPAAQEAQVGGDWYDAFLTPDGALTLVIGDVAGHDRDAAATMAQLRNVLRGVAQIVAEPPAAVLSALDGALHGLQVPALATAVLCQVRGGEAGGRVLRWSNAGHPPPVLIRAGGTAELLARDADLLLGLDPDLPREDHEVVLEAGATVVLYTDGLVERRDQGLDSGLERLRAATAELRGLPPEALCDALLDRLAADAEDDVALLVLRVRSRDDVVTGEPGPGAVPAAAGTGSAGGGPREPVTLVLEPDPVAVRRARTYVRARCAEAGFADEVTDVAVLLTSEVVTNAFTHGRSEARVSVTVGDGSVLVEVGDDNSRHPIPAYDDADALDGRGLTILRMLSARWGVRDDAFGKVVWFEVRGGLQA